MHGVGNPVAVAATVVYVSASTWPAACGGYAYGDRRGSQPGGPRSAARPAPPGRVLAALPQALYLEFADTVPEPRVIAISPPDAIRLPNAIITGLWEALRLSILSSAGRAETG